MYAWSLLENSVVTYVSIAWFLNDRVGETAVIITRPIAFAKLIIFFSVCNDAFCGERPVSISRLSGRELILPHYLA
jgi:hypothetical protein